ncbi:MAG: hypothetical protein JWM76_1625 [Pseudonocardiales bacterium]|nr:hypothetical protein [Pseudonocardiales bacterium]
MNQLSSVKQGRTCTVKVVRTRLLVLLVTAFAVLGLAGCQTKTGAAAIVGGSRVTEKDVSDYLVTDGSDPARAKLFVVSFLVKEKLYSKYLDEHGGIPSAAALDATHDDAVAKLLSQDLGTGAAADALIDKALIAAGVKASLRPAVLRAAEYEYATLFANQTLSADQFFAKIGAAGIKVSISPRYGSWDPKLQDVAAVKVPNFLAVTPTPTATPAS